MKYLMAVLVALVVVGCEEPEQPIYGVDPATMQCRKWNVDKQAFDGPFLPIGVCSGKATPEVIPEATPEQE